LDRILKVWDIKSGKKIQSFSSHSDTICDIKLSSNGRYIVSIDYNGNIIVSDIKTGEENIILKGNNTNNNSYSLAIGPNGKYIIFGNNEYHSKKIKLLNINGKILKVFQTTSSIDSLLFSSDGKYILYGSYNGIGVREINSSKLIKRFKNENKFIHSLSLLDENLIVSHWNFSSFLWNINNGQRIKKMKYSNYMLEDKKKKLSIYCLYKKIGFLDIKNDKTIKEIGINENNGNNDLIRYISISDDGKYLLSGNQNYTARVWDVNKEQIIKEFKTKINAPTVGVSPDGNLYAIGDEIGLKIWNRANNRLLKISKIKLNSSN